MEIARFGNWSVTTYKIEWKGDNHIEFAISIPNIVNTGSHKNCIFYQWLIEIASDTRFTGEDIYSLNTAFFYALDNFRTEIEIPEHALLAETLKEQQVALSERKQRGIMPTQKIAADNSTWFGKLYKL
jgi:hypothetical protein